MNDQRKLTPSWRIVLEDGYSPECLWYTRWVNQYLALPVSYACWVLGMRPNAITVLSIIFTWFGVIVLFAMDVSAWCTALCAYGCLAFGYVLDSSDGQLARAAKQSSRAGQWLDHFFDGLKLLLVNLAFGWILISSATDSRSVAYSVGAMALNLCGQCGFFLAWNFKVLMFGKNLVAKSMGSKRNSGLLSLLLQPTDFGLFILLALLLPLNGWFRKAHLAYGVYNVAVATGYVLLSVRTMLKMDQLGGAGAKSEACNDQSV